MNTYGRATATASALILILSTGTAMADLTPADVWTDWKAYLGDLGFTVTADEADASGVLTLTNIILNQTLPEDGGDMTITIPEISLSDNGNGTVAVNYPDVMPLSVSATGSDAFGFDLIYRTTDMDMNVSGNPSEMTYVYTLANLGVSVENLRKDGKAVDFGTMVFDLADVKGETLMRIDDGRKADQAIHAGGASYAIAATDIENKESTLAMAGHIDDLALMSKLVLPKNVDFNDMAAALASGFSVAGQYTFGPSSADYEFTDGGAVTKGTSTSGGGLLAVNMDDENLRYGGSTSDIQVEATVPQLPFPVTFALNEARFELAMPVTKSQDPQDFGLTLTLGDVALGDSIWALFDPEGELPRDPANVALDVEGKATLKADIFDPAQIANTEDGSEPPAELNALTLKRLLVNLVGAELSGEGDVTFDNSNPEAYGGAPVPLGDISLTLKGANALLDKLVTIGVLPQEQVMGVRMMMSIMAVPGQGEDVLNSKIEFTEGGGIVANGQRLK